jgi:predicted anti-sigma-YlaC factor YlaD
MLTCREVSRDLASDRLRTARLGRRLAIRAHLLMCAACRRFAREIAELGGAMRELAESGERPRLDIAAEQRIIERLREQLPGDDRGSRRTDG